MVNVQPGHIRKFVVLAFYVPTSYVHDTYHFSIDDNNDKVVSHYQRCRFRRSRWYTYLLYPVPHRIWFRYCSFEVAELVVLHAHTAIDTIIGLYNTYYIICSGPGQWAASKHRILILLLLLPIIIIIIIIMHNTARGFYLSQRISVGREPSKLNPQTIHRW